MLVTLTFIFMAEITFARGNLSASGLGSGSIRLNVRSLN